MADTRRYTLINPAGIEASIAVTPSVFKRDYEPQGWTLGFATDGNREPYSDAALKALEKGAKKLQADGKARGIPTFPDSIQSSTQHCMAMRRISWTSCMRSMHAR